MCSFPFDPLQQLIKNVPEYNKHLATLLPSQREFVTLLENWFQFPERLFVLVSGGPGSGKTHTVVKTLENFKANIIIMAPTARLASKIGGRTIHSMMKLNWVRGSVLKCIEERLTHVDDVNECLEVSSQLQSELNCIVSKVDIVVIDEVGMLPFWLLYQIVFKFFDRRQPILFVCMGDNCQLKPVTSQYNVFQVPFEKYFKTIHIQMQESKRFTEEYRLIIAHLRDLVTSANSNAMESIHGMNGNNNNGVPIFEEEEGITTENDLAIEKIQNFVKCHYPVVPCLTTELLNEACRVLAYTNQTVDSCNKYYIEEKFKYRRLFHLYEFRDNEVNREKSTLLRENCAVVVTENGCGPVCNGTTLQFINYHPKEDVAVCLYEGKQEVYVCRSQKSGLIPLVPGFAVTIHKFQGETIDEKNIIFSFDQCKDLHLIYTALSRVRDISQVLAVVL